MTDQKPVALITGAAGSIGKATAKTLLGAGWRVALLDRREDQLSAVAAELGGGGASKDTLELAVDQTDREQVDRAVAGVEERLGGISGLFANAGYGQFAPFLEITSRAWSKHIDVNLNGTFNVCQAVARAMVAARRPGAFVLNASSGAWVYSDQLGAYCVSKSGVRMLAIGMASELGVHRIRVNSIMPGVVETAMTEGMLADDRHRQWLLAETPVGRLGTPEDVAALVAFLLSEESSFITGASIPLDGGETIHGHPRWFAQDYRNAHDDTWKIGP